MIETQTTQVRTQLWLTPDDFDDDHEGTNALVEVERPEPNEIALHTFIDGEGSKVSFYFDRENAIQMAHAFLSAASQLP